MVSPALYETTIHHVRQSPLKHAFTYKSYWWLVDLDALPSYGVLGRFRAKDHIGSSSSLRANVDTLLAGHGLSCDRVLMVSNARVLGHVFNPLSLHYCLASDGSVVAVIAEVHNTYGGRHAYVLETDAEGRARTDKHFYVSPFNTVEGHYDMRLPLPGEELRVDLTYGRPDGKPFVATVRGTRLPATRSNVLLAAVRHPMASRAVSLRIRIQGIRLWLRKLPVIPRNGADSLTTTSSNRTKEHVA
ncbi:MAG: hypothetical protein JWO22_3277 [Frankiales bacterium]|nr:hypothetical protein [Frankiales bacterium]